MRELYEARTGASRSRPGSQDMVGLLYPGVCRLDYDASVEGGVFPSAIETCTTPEVARWLERVIKVLPVAPRPAGYEPLAVQNLDPAWIARLGRSGRVLLGGDPGPDAAALGESMNECMRCWEALLPQVVRPPSSPVDLAGLLRLLPGTLSRGDVLGVRRRVPLRGKRGAGAGSFSVQVRTGAARS